MNIKITVEYDGTHYHGWQIQSRGETIQAVLEKAVSTFLKTPTRITGSGRTDAGVHALGQVANFFSADIDNPHRIRRALNALTPDNIAIREVEI
ncbi:MAG TPA: tRNA pseudouridine synthase A, partial [Candidatus Binatia bacterium]